MRILKFVAVVALLLAISDHLSAQQQPVPPAEAQRAIDALQQAVDILKAAMNPAPPAAIDCVVSPAPPDWLVTSAAPIEVCQPNGQQDWLEQLARTVVTEPSVTPPGAACPALIGSRTVPRPCTYVPPPPPPPPTHNHTASGLTHNVPNFWANPTAISVKDGDWNSRDTWRDGVVPGADDVAWVRGRVNYCLQSSAPLKAVGISGGTLSFCPGADTRLVVGTLVVEPDGALEIGTVAEPIHSDVKAEIVIDGRALDLAKDAEQFGTGLLGFGKVTMVSALKDSFVRMAGDAPAGAKTVTLARAPIGWRPGDKVVFPDTRQVAGFVQIEERVIESVSGAAVTLTQPLTFLHEGARDGNGVVSFNAHVLNLSHPIAIRSGAPSGVRGHVMFATRADVHLDGVELNDLGRTLMTPLSNTAFSAAGAVTSVGTNQQGRYALHMHHVMGPLNRPGAYQFELLNISTSRSTKWGVAIHNSHYGLLDGIVAYASDGAGIAFEDGSESFNVLQNSFVLKVNAAAGGGNGTNRGTGDLGWEGAGFWFRGPNNTVMDNVAAGIAGDFGFKILQWNLGTIRVPNFRGADTSVAGQYTTVPGTAIPFRGFERNEVYSSLGGLQYWWVCAVSNTAAPCQADTVFKDFHVWHISKYGIYHYPATRLLIDGYVARNKASAVNAMGFFGQDYYTENFTIANADIQGMAIGIIPTTRGGKQTIRDSYLRNVVDLQVETLWSSDSELRKMPPRDITVSNVRFDLLKPVPGSSVTASWAIEMFHQNRLGRNLVQSDQVFVKAYNGVAGDDFTLRYLQQAPTFVVPPTQLRANGDHAVEGLPILNEGTPQQTFVTGLTNTQAWAQYKIAFAGSISPCATTRAGIVGFVCAVVP